MISEFWNGISVIKRLYSRKLEAVCKAHYLARMDVDILLFLANNPKFDTAKDIVEQRQFTKSHVSAALKSLEKRGYIARKFYEGNRKTVHIMLLPAADEIIRDGRKAQLEFGNILFGSFGKEELIKMEESFEKIVQNVKDTLQEEK